MSKGGVTYPLELQTLIKCQFEAIINDSFILQHQSFIVLEHGVCNAPGCAQKLRMVHHPAH